MKIWRWIRYISQMSIVAVIALFIARPLLPGLFWQLSVVFSVPTRSKLVALTYDDGPHPVYTPELLRILDRYHIKATFFMVGSHMEQYPAIVKEVIDHGDVIGNHTFTHPHMFETETSSQMNSEIGRCEKVIEQMSGHRTHLFRPPLGWVNGTMLQTIRKDGYQIILWTVCADHHDAPTPQLMADRVFRQVRPGAIILLHDGSYAIRWKDVAATPIIIEGLRKQGYRFVTLPQLLASAGR